MKFETDYKQFIRVLKLADKPDKEEFKKVALIAAISIFAVGIIGFTIFFLMSFIPM